MNALIPAKLERVAAIQELVKSRLLLKEEEENLSAVKIEEIEAIEEEHKLSDLDTASTDVNILPPVINLSMFKDQYSFQKSWVSPKESKKPSKVPTIFEAKQDTTRVREWQQLQLKDLIPKKHEEGELESLWKAAVQLDNEDLVMSQEEEQEEQEDKPVMQEKASLPDSLDEEKT